MGSGRRTPWSPDSDSLRVRDKERDRDGKLKLSERNRSRNRSRSSEASDDGSFSEEEENRASHPGLHRSSDHLHSPRSSPGRYEGDRYRSDREEGRRKERKMVKDDSEDDKKKEKEREREKEKERDGRRHNHRSSTKGKREMDDDDVDKHEGRHRRHSSSRKSERKMDDGVEDEHDGRNRYRSNTKAEREVDDDDERDGRNRQRSNRKVERDISDDNDDGERDGRHRHRRNKVERDISDDDDGGERDGRQRHRRNKVRDKGKMSDDDDDDDEDDDEHNVRGSHHRRKSRRGERETDNGNRDRTLREKGEQNGDGSQGPSKSKKDEPLIVEKENVGGRKDANIVEKPQGRSGGVYIPPFKLAQMMKDIQDKSSVEYQRITWDALRKSINGLVNKVNASNIKNIIPELLSENLIRGRGLFARSCMKSQMASPSFTHVFAALVAVVNTKFPELGELLLKRIILQFRRALKRNDKPLLLAAAKFVAHLVNQQVAHEVVALEVLMVLLENPTDDSVEVAVGFVKECGAILQDLAPQGLHGIFERFRGILHEGEIDKRVQFMIEGLFAIRKAQFQGHQAVLPELDLVEQEDQFTHEISLSDDLDPETNLDIFRPDKDFLENEKQYEKIKKDILGEEVDDGEESSGGSDDSDESDEDDEEEAERMQIKDETETNLVNLRRTIYLTIMSSVDFEEAGHKLLKIKLEPGQEMELNIMLLECCSQERTYLRYYGLLGQRFCMINKIYQENFDECFVKQYSMIHRLETNKLRNVAKFFAHLLGTDALPWNVLGYIRLTEEDTTSSSRIFIKILFQELSEHLGLRKLNEKLNDPIMQDSFEGIFPKDNPKNTRFAINFFTSIGLGGITDSLREYLKNMPRLIMQQQRQIESESDSDESSEESDTSSSGSDSGDSTDSESSSSESESESEPENKKRRKR